MKNIRFARPEGQKFIQALRKNVHHYFRENDLSTKGNHQMTIKTTVMILLYFTPFILMLTLSMPVWCLLMLSLVMGVGKAGTGMCVMHDALHGSYSEKNWKNRLFGSTMYMLGDNIFNWKIQHNMHHHAYTNIDGHDEDINHRLVLRLHSNAEVFAWHRFQHIYAPFLYCFLTIARQVKDFLQLIEYSRNGIMKQQNANPVWEFSKMLFYKSLYFLGIIGLPLWFTDIPLWLVLVNFAIAHMVAGFILGLTFQLAHIVENIDHPVPDSEGHIENEWAVHQLLTTANFARNNKLLSWYIGGLNFQIEHHLFPNICHIHYARISPIVEQTAHEFGLPYHTKPNLRGAVASHIRALKALGNVPRIKSEETELAVSS